jgi:hypothetical protein
MFFVLKNLFESNRCLFSYNEVNHVSRILFHLQQTILFMFNQGISEFALLINRTMFLINRADLTYSTTEEKSTMT